MKITYLMIVLALAMVAAGCGGIPSSGSLTWGADSQQGSDSESGGSNAAACENSQADVSKTKPSDDNDNGNSGNSNTDGDDTGADNAGGNQGSSGNGGNGCAQNGGGSDEGDQDTPDSEDTTGGISYVEPVEPQAADRHFMGTWMTTTGDAFRVIQYEAPYDKACTYTFPSTIRMFAHDGKIDMEDNQGKLAWVADVYPDDTSDFNIGLLDRYGRESARIYCTCSFHDSYYSYVPEAYICGCEASNKDEPCTLAYARQGS